MNAGSHCDRLAAAVSEQGLDALLVGDLVRPGDSGPDAIANIRWLTGFSGTSGFAVVGSEQRVFVTDFRYGERAERDVDPEFERLIAAGRLLPELASRMSGRVGFDDAQTSVMNHAKLQAELADGVELVPAGGLLERLRRVKDEPEVEAMAAASKLADEVFEWSAERGLAGRTEREVALAAEGRIRELGGEPSFPVIVAAGANGAQPHAEPGERKIAPGELVVFDMGAKLDGYCSDGTRTFASGEPGEQEREVYELVLSAQLAGLEATRAGVSGVDADKASRDLIEAAGHGDHFGHGLGHGVGLEVHEAPRLSPRSDDTLGVGDAVTVEPGVYVPGRFGVRIEDLVVLTGDGLRNLSGTPKELRVTG